MLTDPRVEVSFISASRICLNSSNLGQPVWL